VAISTRELLLVLRARDEASKVLRGAAADINGVSAAAAQAAQKQIQQGAAIATVGVAVAYAGLKALEFMNDATNAAIEYNRQSALTLTQVDQVGVKLGTIKDIGRDVATSVPTDFKKIQASLYDIFSSMNVSVPQAKVLLTEFSKASVAGQVDLQDASRATIGILNAYGLKATDVTRINDVMFQLVRKGVGTYGEFASTIGRAVPSAVRAGQSVESLAGMMAFLTRNGLSAAMASASAGRALDAISNPNTIQHFKTLGSTVAEVAGKNKAIEIFGKNYASAGIQIADASGHIKPMTTIMTELGKAIGNLPDAQRSAVLYELFKNSGGTIQARRFFDVAVKGYSQLTDLTNSMINSKGAMEDAYNIMLEQPAVKLQLLSNRWEVLKTVIGDTLLPIKMFIVDGISKLMAMFENLSPSMQKTIVIFLAITAAVAVLAGVIVAIAGVVLMFQGALALAGTTAAAFLAPIGILIAVIVGLGAAIYLVWKYHDQLWAKAKEVWGGMAPYIMPVVDFIKLLASVIYDFFIKALIETWNTVKNSFNPALDSLKQAWNTLLPAIMAIWNALQPLMPYLKDLAMIIGVILAAAIGVVIAAFIVAVNFIAGILGPTVTALANIVKAAAEVISGVIKVIVGLLTGNWKMAWEGAQQVVKGVWDAMVALVVGAINIVIGAVKGLWNGVIAVFNAAKDVLVGHSIVPDLINAIVMWFLTLPGRVLAAIAGLVGSLGTWARNALTNGYNAFVSVGGTILSWMAGLPGRILSALGNTGSLLYDAGRNFLQGLLNGIGSMVQAVYNKVSSVASTVRSLWPFSPAKAGPLRSHPMDKAGATLMKQLASGIESRRDLVLSSMKNIAFDVSQTQPSAPVVSAPEGGPGGNGSGGGNTYQTFNISTQEIDPTKHAADLGWELARRRG
jgi:TP901 family phage tail tape measure protein